MNVDKLFYNGNVITVDSNFSVQSAVAIKDDRIVDVGTDKMLETYTAMESIDLQGKTMMPGIIDAHGHFGMSLRFANWADLTIKDFYSNEKVTVDDLIEIMKKHKKDQKINDKDLVIGFGYHESRLVENRILTKFDLDRVSTTQPVIVANISLHLFTFNSVALKDMGIDENFEDPESSIVHRIEGTKEPIGYIQGPLAQELVFNLSNETEAMKLEGFKKTQKEYYEVGITTMQEGKSTLTDIESIKLAMKNDLIIGDIVSYIDFRSIEEIVEKFNIQVGEYDNHFKVGGLKMISDGTLVSGAYLTKPFEGTTDDYGIEYCSREEVRYAVNLSFDKNWPILIHAMGDAAIDKFMDVYEEVANERNVDLSKYRNTLNHASAIRKDQLKRAKELGLLITMYPSAACALYEVFCKTIGKERADYCNPLKDAFDVGLNVTMHNDAPIIGPDPFILLWSGVNRQSVISGKPFGQDQCISVRQAIEALTINGAYQYFEENEKGSIEKGKRADLIIIDKNPLAIDKADLGKITVLETIKDGVTVYSK